MFGYSDKTCENDILHLKQIWVDVDSNNSKINLSINKNNYIQSAYAVLNNVSDKTGIKNTESELESLRVEKDNLNFHHVRFEQKYKNLPVFGGEIIVHFNSDNKVYNINGTYVAEINVDTNSLINSTNAISFARKSLLLSKKASATLVSNPELLIFAYNSKPELAYEVVLYYEKPNAPPCRWHYFVSANDGKILFRYNNIKTAPLSPNGVHKNIYGNVLEGESGALTNVLGWHNFDNNNNYLYNTNLKWIVSNKYPGSYINNATNYFGDIDRAAMSAAVNFNIVEKYFLEVHNRKNFHNGRLTEDNNESYAQAVVHKGNNLNSAYWDGRYFYFGNGDGITANSYATLDVCGHEFTHAVTDYSADLIYADESGALNESFSDIFGTAVEFYAQKNESLLYPDYLPGCADWLLGEDFYLLAPAYRDLRNPANTETVGENDEQPTRYLGQFWYYGEDDNGGVHQNSGVQNFFFYLLSKGGSGTNDGIVYDVTGINITNSEQIAYRALTVYCTYRTDYSSVRSVWISAAYDLNPAWVDNVESAWEAVGVGDFRVLPAGEYVFSGEVGGEFLTSSIQPELRNTSSEPLQWFATNEQSWLCVTPMEGFLNPGETTNIFLSVNTNANILLAGTYSDFLSVIDITNAITETRKIILKILPPIVYSFLIDDNFPNWNIEGLWAYGKPDGRNGDPAAAYSGTNIYGYNLSGIYENNIPAYYLTTRSLDFSKHENVSFTFWRWFGIENSIYDHAEIEISTNGVEWFTIWKFEGKTFEDTSWQRMIYDISNIADKQKNVYIRWGMGPTDVGVGYGGWNIDDVVFYGTEIDKLEISPDNNFVFWGNSGGPFSPSNIFVKLKNAGGNAINWTVVSTSSWVNIMPTNGTLATGEIALVSLFLNSESTNFGIGNYFSEICFNNISSGNLMPRSVKLAVLDQLTADFTAIPLTGAAPLAVNFQDYSTGDIKHWSWDFDNDGIVNSTNPNTQFTFFDAGIYNVKLSVDNNYMTSSVFNSVVVTGNSYTVRYVSKNGAHVYPFTSWETAATNFQNAIEAAFPGNTILVTNGIYNTGFVAIPDSALTNRIIIDKAITVKSVNGPDYTIIAGCGQINSQAMRCVYLNNREAVISGFTISNGQTLVDGNYIDRYGGGIYIDSGGTVSNCIILNCYAENKGGGIYINEQAEITDCIIKNNLSDFEGGGIYCNRNAKIKNSEISDNSSKYNGGIYCYNSFIENCIIDRNIATYNGGIGCHSSEIINCNIVGNIASNGSAGGVGCYIGIIRNCRIIGNSAIDAGGIYSEMSKIFNSAISGNYAENEGGGVMCMTWTMNEEDYDIIQNCTINGNAAGKSSGGLYTRLHAKIRNCIIYNNIAPIFPNWYSNSSRFKYNCITPLPSKQIDEKNIDLDPVLLDSAHITLDSPCRIAGNSAWCTGVDIDGENWSFPGTIGCDYPTIGTKSNDLKISISSFHNEFTIGYSNAFIASIIGKAESNFWDFGNGDIIANKINVNYSWASSGVYDVAFYAFNDSYPNGISDTITVTVTAGNIFYVSEKNSTPAPPYNSWVTAATNIYDAVDYAILPGSIVLISNGNYILAEQINLENEITVKGADSAEKIIIDGNNKTRCFYINNPAVTIENLTVVNGSSDKGGGIYSDLGGYIKNCIITKNNSDSYGGGIYCYRGGVIEQCRIIKNHARFNGGGVYLENRSIIKESTIENNTTEKNGGGIYLNSSSIENCKIIINNALGYGGGIYSEYDSLIQNCLVKENISNNDGGGIINFYSIVQSCTIVGNETRKIGGGIVCGDFNTLVQNCIIWGNSTNAFFYNIENTAYNCCIEDCTNITNGIITNDPNFLSFDDFHLKNGSLCINSGTNSAYVFNSTDLEGNARVIEIITDMGAYEFGNFYCSFTADKTENINELSCSFSAVASAENTEQLFYFWDFENDGVFDLQGEFLSEVPHTYSTTGTYSVLLFVSNSVGGNAECLREDYINILAPVKADFSVNKTVAEIFENVQFNDLSINNPDRWLWDFYGNDSIDSYEQNPVTNFNSIGYKTVKLTVSNKFTSDFIIKSNVVFIVERTINHYVSIFGNSIPPYTNWLTAATNIQDAIDTTLADDIVWISNGVYFSAGYIKDGTNCFVLNKKINIKGIGKKVVINGQNKMRGAYVSGGKIENLMFINGIANGEKNAGCGGGVLCDDNSEISRCIFINNFADEGGAISITNNDVMKSCLIISNSAIRGGGIKVSRSAEVYNLTIADNFANENGGGILCESYVNVINSIIYNNIAPSDSNYFNDGINIFYNNCCSLNNDFYGSSNITNYPEFLEDYSIPDDSPCCDAGRLSSWMFTAKDLAGVDRIQGDRVDIGAYESIPEPFIIGVICFGLIFAFKRFND